MTNWKMIEQDNKNRIIRLIAAIVVILVISISIIVTGLVGNAHSAESNVLHVVGLKIATVIVSALTGMVAAIWAVATKVKGFEDKEREHDKRIKRLEESQKELMTDLKKDLMRIHDRIDDLYQRKI